jgi:hypothetical protein
MRIKFWASLLLSAAPLAAAQQPLTLTSGATITATGTPSHTLLHFHGAKQQVVSLQRDATIARGSISPKLKLLGDLPDVAVILTDTYPSRPAGLSRCQAGEEQFLRVITTSGPRPVETLHLKLASCRDTIELSEPGLLWSADTRTLQIQWLTPPAGQPKDRTVTLTATGQPSIR